MTLTQKLPRLLAQEGLSQAEVARAVGAGTATVSGWLKGKTTPSLALALPLARRLRVPLEYLADDTLDEPPPPPSEARRRIEILIDTIGEAEALRRLAQVAATNPGTPPVPAPVRIGRQDGGFPAQGTG